MEEIIMFSIRLPAELERDLNMFSKQQSTHKSKVVIEALKRYLEDSQDYIQASNLYAQNNKRYTNEEIMNEFKIQN